MTDGFAVLRAAGRFAAPVPLAETLMAGWLLARAGIAVPGGPMTIAPVHADGHIALGADGRLGGRARRVPFARNAGHIAVLVHRGGEPAVALVAADGLAISQAKSLAGEPRDDVSFDGATPEAVQAGGGRRRQAAVPRRRGAAAADGRRARKDPRAIGPMVARPLAVRPPDRQVPGGPAQSRDPGRRGRRGGCRRRSSPPRPAPVRR